MRAFIQQYYQRVVASYWFIPSIMAVSAAVLAFVLIEIDARVPLDAFGESPFFYATQPDGARAILSAIGGSMIGVAGTVFSVTMATVVFASGSYGPRRLTNFMNDRGNQITLGVFVATFIYSMLVLRSELDQRLAATDQALQAIDNFRLQTNRSLSTLQSQLSALHSRVEGN